ncbi:hypothetical protein LTR22_016241 [Elasticomyces elasticus]|nr:hypothetical protein LTR22_016241 [Elasticomyces elasticus]KAK4914285.1 hypothetical protein LTR49_017423 [Elasticomyces elasticus]KAK5769125.1 hypothetical protein LTS12_000839 [Elasticomyces elasticus]
MSSRQASSASSDGAVQDAVSVSAGRREERTAGEEKPLSSPRAPKPSLAASAPVPKPHVNFAEDNRRTSSELEGALSPAATDRVFPIRSQVSVDVSQTPGQRDMGSYFQSTTQARRPSLGSSSERSQGSKQSRTTGGGGSIGRQSARQTGQDQPMSPREPTQTFIPGQHRKPSTSSGSGSHTSQSPEEGAGSPSTQQKRKSAGYFNQMISGGGGPDSEKGEDNSTRPPSARSLSQRSIHSNEDMGGLVTARFKHIVTEGGHAVITGRDGETLQRCEDEPIHIPGAVQGFGLLIALEEVSEAKLEVKVVSENSKRLIGYTPKQLFALDSFTDILTEEQTDNLLDHVDFIRDDDADVTVNGPEVFTMSIRSPQRKNIKLWVAMHVHEAHPHLIICEFELEDDQVNPLVPPNDSTPEPAEDTLGASPTEEEFAESTRNASKPLRVLRSARKRKGEAAAMEVFNIMSQVQEQLAAAPNLEEFLRVLVGVVKELTGFHRVMIYQFDSTWNGRVVTELVDRRATKDLYKGLNFPASDIPKQARDLYKINKVRMLYDRDQETARLVCRTLEELEQPLDLTYSYLRAMSPIHLKYLTNMAVRSSMSVSINAFDELWGLIACHGYGSKGMRVSFPIRKMCRLVGDTASRNIERLSYASRLQARKLINTVPTSTNPSGYIIASSEDLLKLFDADFGLLSIRGETKIMGNLEQTQEALAMLEYLRMRQITNVMTSQDIKLDFPDLRYGPGFTVIAGLLLVPLSAAGQDFIVFFRRGQMREVKWAGNPYEKYIKEGTEGYLEPRKSFRTWSEQVVGTCRDWTEEEIETAAVLCLVYGKFIEVWRQKEAALQNSQLTRLLLANSAHEVRTPLNAIINYLEIALEGALDTETRDNLAKSHSASKSLIYVINDLLDLTKTEEGGELTKDEIFDLKATLMEATDMFKGDARRKGLKYEVKDHPGLPGNVIGDQRRVRQAISNITANAIQNTTQGSVKVEMYPMSRVNNNIDIEIAVEDTGTGMSAKKLDALFRELEQVQSEGGDEDQINAIIPDAKTLTEGADEKSSQKSSEKDRDSKKALGLGLAVVARIIRNVNGQLRLKSEEGKGSRFVVQFPFELPNSEPKPQAVEAPSEAEAGSITPQAEAPTNPATPPVTGEVTLVERGSVARRGSTGDSHGGRNHSRRNSGGSDRSHKSTGSVRSSRSAKSGTALSFASQQSGRSEADRLIDAISDPHMVSGHHNNSITRSGSRGSGRGSGSGGHGSGSGGTGSGSGNGSGSGSGSGSAGASRPRFRQRHTATGTDALGSPGANRYRAASHYSDHAVSVATPSKRDTKPGESSVEGQGQPIRAVRMPDDGVTTPGTDGPTLLSASPARLGYQDHAALPDKADEPATTNHMRVLVAEDDPVNSRIIKKRLEKIGHEVFLTINGEECSSTYGDKSGYFDIILMDMQMPIVDGLTSTKLIRSYEKSHPSHTLSARASLNGRVPIIAVSASLIEKDRQMYIDAGFDGWILKPIAFARLGEIMTGIVDSAVRARNLYRQGSWEQGGWFERAQKDIFAADTNPNQKPPTSAPGHEATSQGVKIAAASDDPFVKEEDDSRQSQEQTRMLAEQERVTEEVRERDQQDRQEEAAGMAQTLPELGSTEYMRDRGVSPGSSETVTTQIKAPSSMTSDAKRG